MDSDLEGIDPVWIQQHIEKISDAAGWLPPIPLIRPKQVVVEPVPRKPEMNSGIATGLALLLVGLMCMVYPEVRHNNATAAWNRAKWEATDSMKDLPHKRVKVADYLTEDEISTILADRHDNGYQGGLGFLTTLVGLAFFLGGLAGCKADEFLITGAIGYGAYKAVSKII